MNRKKVIYKTVYPTLNLCLILLIFHVAYFNINDPVHIKQLKYLINKQNMTDINNNNLCCDCLTATMKALYSYIKQVIILFHPRIKKELNLYRKTLLSNNCSEMLVHFMQVTFYGCFHFPSYFQ